MDIQATEALGQAAFQKNLPVYLYEKGVELPKVGKYYVITKTGIYMHKETKAGSALVPVDGIPWLQEPDLEFRLDLPKIPGRIIGQALTFFREVFRLYESESYVTLLYSKKLGQYMLWCPKQKVSRASVNYDRTDLPSFEDRGNNVKENDNWQLVGTIHSHCDFSAFHSSTDTGDEASFDGIHITLGHVNRQQFSMVASVAMNDKRESLDPENCCTGIVRVANKDVITSKFMTWGESSYFDFELSEEDVQALVEDAEFISSEWMPKVEKQVWAWGGKKAGPQTKGWGSWWDKDDELYID